MTGFYLPHATPALGELPDTDPACQALAIYLMQGLNTAIKVIHPNHVAVRSVTCYDAVNPDLSRFPLIKVYRTTDTYKDFSSTTQAEIPYCMTFPDVDKLPGILRWVSREVNRLLRERSLGDGYCDPRINVEQELKAEYRLMVNEVSQPVYAFLRFNFSFSEG